MIHEMHPEVADRIVVALEGDGHTIVLSAASSAGRQLVGVEGFDPPSWHAPSLGARPVVRELDFFEPGAERDNWQHEASSRVELEHRERRILPRLADNEKAMLRSQSGPGSGLALSATPSNFFSSRIEPHLFRVLPLRRSFVVVGRRGFPVESAITRIRREGGARVSTNVFVWDLGLGAFNHLDGRRLEVVADGLSLFGGA